jgi:DNA-binding NarL/FixJ family response regulator
MNAPTARPSTPRTKSSAVTQNRRTRCLIADESHLIRDLITTLLQREKGDVLAVRGVEDANAVLETGPAFHPDILLMELNALKNANGHIHLMKEMMPATRLLVYAVAASDVEIVDALRAGVDGFCSKGTSREQFLEAVDRLARGEHYFCARSNRLLTEIAQGKHSETTPSGESVLSPREEEILLLIASGKTSKEIAADLNLSAATVDTHRRNAMSKVRARNAADLIRYGYDHGLLFGHVPLHPRAVY